MGNDVQTVWAQEAKAHELIRDGNRTLADYSRLLQAFNGDDAVQITPKTVLKENGLYHVTGNFVTLEEAITAGGYDLLHGEAQQPEEIPMGIQPVDEFVDLAPTAPLFTEGRDYVTGEEIYNSALPTVSLLGLLAFGAKFPEVQRKHWLVTAWRDGLGRPWYAVLSGKDTGRSLEVERCDLGEKFYSDDRLLRSRRLPSPQAAWCVQAE